jgi:hypothetical protein
MPNSSVCGPPNAQVKKSKLAFPRILLDLDEKGRFIGIVEENKNSIHDALGGFFCNSERGYQNNDYSPRGSDLSGRNGNSTSLGVIENASPDKNMYLDGIPELNQSPYNKIP